MTLTAVLSKKIASNKSEKCNVTDKCLKWWLMLAKQDGLLEINKNTVQECRFIATRQITGFKLGYPRN